METSKYGMFKRYLAALNNLAQNSATHEGFVELQKTQADILNDYTYGGLCYRERQALFCIATILEDYFRYELGLSYERRMKCLKEQSAQS